MVIWITGKAKAGKTTLAYNLKEILKGNIGEYPIVIDGDNVRELFVNDFSDTGRKNNVITAAKIAHLTEVQGCLPIVSLISPVREVRMRVCEFFEDICIVYVYGGYLWEGTSYEEPDITEYSMIYDWRASRLIDNTPRSRKHKYDIYKYINSLIGKKDCKWI